MLQIVDELRGVLSTEDVQRTIAVRNTTDVRCVVCLGEIPAGSPETVNVLVSENAVGAAPVQSAHERCHPSGFTGRRSEGLIGQGLVARFRVREHPACPAVLVWEPYEQLRIDSEEVHTRFYRWLGLRPLRDGVLGTGGPWLQTVRVTLTAARASVALTAQGVKTLKRKVPVHPGLRVGEEWDGFSLAPVASVVAWRAAAARTGRCLLVTGTGLGLEHPSAERESLLLEDGDALTGVAPVTVSRGSGGGG
jgi:hypothetical protein